MIVSFIGFISCQKDKKDSGKVSIQESKDNLNNFSTDLQHDINKVYDKSGWQALNTFANLLTLDDPTNGSLNLKKSAHVKPSLKQLLSLKSTFRADDHLVFEDYVGTYTWNVTNQGWDITQNDPSDKIIFLFPLDGPQGTSNNSTLTIYDFLEVQITETDDYGTYSYWVPSSVQADLTVDGTKYLDINLSAAWNASSGEPENFSVSSYVNPYTLSLTLSQSGSTATAEVILSEGDTRVCSVGGDLTFSSSALLDPLTLNGYVQYRNVKLAGDMNIGAIMALETDPTTDFLNENLDLAFYNYPENSKFADVVFNTTNYQMGVNIAFTDGTTMDGLVFINNLLTTLDGYIPDGLTVK